MLHYLSVIYNCFRGFLKWGIPKTIGSHWKPPARSKHNRNLGEWPTKWGDVFIGWTWVGHDRTWYQTNSFFFWRAFCFFSTGTWWGMDWPTRMMISLASGATPCASSWWALPHLANGRRWAQAFKTLLMLVGGLEHGFYFFHMLGIIIPTD